MWSKIKGFMKKLKEIALIFLFVFVGIFAFGCSQVTLSTTIKGDGDIIYTVKIDLSDVSNSAGIKKFIQEYYNQLENAYKQNLIDKFSNVYSSQGFNFSEMSQEDKYTFVVNKNKKFYIDDITSLTSTISSSVVVVQKYFSSAYAYLMFFNPDAFYYDVDSASVKISKEYSSLIDVPINSTMQNEEQMFFTKYLQKCKPFSYNNQEPVLLAEIFIDGSGNYTAGQSVVEVISDIAGITEQQAKLYFNFSTPYRRVHSDGEITLSASGYNHFWELSTVNDEISIWRTFANPAPWYIIALGATLVGFTIALITLITIKNKNKKVGLETLAKIEQLTNNQEAKNVKEKKD